MTQAISVYIKQDQFWLAISLELLLNLKQQKYVTIWNKATTTQYLMLVICSTIQWIICSYF